MHTVYPIDRKTCRGCEWLVELIGDPDADDYIELYECGNEDECPFVKY